jgi:glycosyltransferase involved in cell wall biosynthesis
MSRKQLTRNNVLVVVPALNEAMSIGGVLEGLLENNLCVVVISDGSVDGTADIARSMKVDVLDLAMNLGVGGALRAGFQFACRQGYEAVIQVDADGQHPIGHIDNLISAANQHDADMIIGSRFIQASSSMSVNNLRRSTMRVLAWSASRAAKTKITDSTSGFRLIRQPLLGRFSYIFASNYLGDTYEALIAAGRAGFKIREIEAPIQNRINGQSSSTTTQSVLQTIKVFTVALLQIHTRL